MRHLLAKQDQMGSIPTTCSSHRAGFVPTLPAGTPSGVDEVLQERRGLQVHADGVQLPSSSPDARSWTGTSAGLLSQTFWVRVPAGVLRSCRLAVRTLPSQGRNGGSIPLRTATVTVTTKPPGTDCSAGLRNRLTWFNSKRGRKLGGVGSSEGLTCITDSLTQWMGPTLRRLVQLVRFQREGPIR